jgi:hypothetical protein
MGRKVLAVDQTRLSDQYHSHIGGHGGHAREGETATVDPADFSVLNPAKSVVLPVRGSSRTFGQFGRPSRRTGGI